jgi:hypothetical protein
MKKPIIKCSNFWIVIAISLFMMYIVYCYVRGRWKTVEHLISSKSDTVDVLTKFSLNWLKNKAKTMDIPTDEISKNLLPKEAYANSIIRYLPRAHREYMMKLSTYSNDRLKEEAFRHGVGVVGKSRRQIMDGIKTATNPKHTIARWKKEKHVVTTSEEEEEEVKHKKSGYAIQPGCPRIYKKCIKDQLLNDYKYTECLDQDNYEKCMSCFNNKIGDSRYIGKGTNFACNYKDMELLCMRKHPDSCDDGDYLNCPCKSPGQDTDNYDLNTKSKNDKHHNMLRKKDHYLLSSSITSDEVYTPASNVSTSQDYMNDYYKDLIKKHKKLNEKIKFTIKKPKKHKT